MIARIQRQKRKYVTAVAGLDTVPDLKIKDAARVFGKKFSSGNRETFNILRTLPFKVNLALSTMILDTNILIHDM